MGEYDKAQICQNGHVVNSQATWQPDHNRDYCPQCGEIVIDRCQNWNCQNPIQGSYRASEYAIPDHPTGEYFSPSFCQHCGKPYLWTERGLSAAKDLVQDLDNLTDDEKTNLSRSLDDLVRQTPQTQVAAGRFKRYMAKAGPAASDAMKKTLVTRKPTLRRPEPHLSP